MHSTINSSYNTNLGCTLSDQCLKEMSPLALIRTILLSSHEDFLTIVKRYQNLQPTASLRSDDIESQLKVREIFTKRRFRPIFTAMGSFEEGKANLPKYELHDFSTSPTFAIEYDSENDLFFAEDAFIDFQTTAVKIPDLEQLHLLCAAMKKDLNLFTWHHPDDGCYARAEIAFDFLFLMGIPKNCSHRQYLLSPHNKEINLSQHNWHYHVAPEIKLPTGESVILDPAYSSTALSKTQWAHLVLEKDTITPAEVDFEVSLSNPLFTISQFTYLTAPLNYEVTFMIDDDSNDALFKLNRLEDFKAPYSESHKKFRLEALFTLDFFRREYELKLLKFNV